MTKRQDAINAWKRVLGGKQDQQLIRYALTGDGSNAATADVDGEIGFAWVRYDERQDKASKVLNAVFPGIAQDVPVMVGKRYPSDRLFQILGINEELYYQNQSSGTFAGYILPNHGGTHTAGGEDWAPIVSGNIVNGMCRRTEPASLSVFVDYMVYENSGTLKQWDGGAIDLTGDVPGANLHRYTVVCINGSNNTLASVLGLASPIPVAPTLPTIPTGYIPSAAVLLENGVATIDESRIYDYRVLFSGVGNYVAWTNKLLSILEAEFDFALTRHVVMGL